MYDDSGLSHHPELICVRRAYEIIKGISRLAVSRQGGESGDSLDMGQSRMNVRVEKKKVLVRWDVSLGCAVRNKKNRFHLLSSKQLVLFKIVSWFCALA